MTSLNQSYTFPSVQIPASNGITFTAKRWGQFPTITFVNSALAGFEVATVDANLNIFITIQSGVTTQTQVIAAITNSANPDNAVLTPASLVSATTTHGSSTVLSFVNVPLTGGLTPAAKATLRLGGLLYTAVSGGTSGNSIRIKYTTGATAGSEIVTVSSNDITIQIADPSVTYTPFSYPTPGVTFTTNAQLIAAVAASTAAAALVTVTVPGGTESALKGPKAFQATAFTNLTGGLAASAASTGAVQGITVVTAANGPATGNAVISLVPGGTAGSEVVTVNADNSVSVQIQAGTSTVTQIVAAMEASTPFTTLYTASGSASTTPTTVFENSMTGASSQFGLGYYTDQTLTTLTTTYQYLAFDDVMSTISIYNDDASGNNKLSVSYDGINVHGIYAATQNATFRPINKSGIYVKYVTGSPAFRIIAANAR